jgi:hypothetical protein
MAIYSKCNYFKSSALHNELNTYNLAPQSKLDARLSTVIKDGQWMRRPAQSKSCTIHAFSTVCSPFPD